MLRETRTQGDSQRSRTEDLASWNAGDDTQAGNEGKDSYAPSEKADGQVDDGYLPPDYPFDWEDRDNWINTVP